MDMDFLDLDGYVPDRLQWTIDIQFWGPLKIWVLTQMILGG